MKKSMWRMSGLVVALLVETCSCAGQPTAGSSLATTTGMSAPVPGTMAGTAPAASPSESPALSATSTTEPTTSTIEPAGTATGSVTAAPSITVAQPADALPNGLAISASIGGLGHGD